MAGESGRDADWREPKQMECKIRIRLKHKEVRSKTRRESLE